MPDAAERPDADWFVLDREYRIVAAATAAGRVEQHIGTIFWDAYPGSRGIYADVYATAWRTGHAESHAFHLGALVHVAADRVSVGLLVAYRVLAELDDVTLPALMASLDRLLRVVECAAQAPPPSPASRGALRLAPGP